MKVAELRSQLEDYEDDDVVMIAHQPSWPIQETLCGVISTDELERDDDYEESEETIVYLVAGGQSYKHSPYAPREVFNF